MQENREDGHPPDKVAILASTRSMQTFTDALKTMADSVPIHMDVTNNIIDTARVLGLEDRADELQKFWEQVRQSSAGPGPKNAGDK